MVNSRFVSENEKLFFALRELLSKVEDITGRYEKLKINNQYLNSNVEKLNKTLNECTEYSEKLESEKNVFSDELLKLQKSVLEKEESVVNLSDEIKKLEESNKSFQVRLASNEDDLNKLKNYHEKELTNQKELIKEKERQLEDLNIKYDSKVNILIAENQKLEEELKKSESVLNESKLTFVSEDQKETYPDLHPENGLPESDRKEIKEKISLIIEKIDEMIV
jgi:chromosome segregation ATPase